jgi:hypothetical protein
MVDFVSNNFSLCFEEHVAIEFAPGNKCQLKNALELLQTKTEWTGSLKRLNEGYLNLFEFHKHSFFLLKKKKTFTTFLFVRNILRQDCGPQKFKQDDYRLTRWLFLATESYLYLFDRAYGDLFHQVTQLSISGVSNNGPIALSEAMATVDSVAVFLKSMKMNNDRFFGWIRDRVLVRGAKESFNVNIVKRFLQSENAKLAECRLTKKLLARPRLCLCEAARSIGKFETEDSLNSCEEGIKYGFAEWNANHLRELLSEVIDDGKKQSIAGKHLCYSLANEHEFDLYIKTKPQNFAIFCALVDVMCRIPGITNNKLICALQAQPGIDSIRESDPFGKCKAFFGSAFLGEALIEPIDLGMQTEALALVKVIKRASGSKTQAEIVKLTKRALENLAHSSCHLPKTKKRRLSDLEPNQQKKKTNK